VDSTIRRLQVVKAAAKAPPAAKAAWSPFFWLDACDALKSHEIESSPALGEAVAAVSVPPQALNINRERRY
jgi:hypothetical protein